MCLKKKRRSERLEYRGRRILLDGPTSQKLVRTNLHKKNINSLPNGGWSYVVGKRYAYLGIQLSPLIRPRQFRCCVTASYVIVRMGFRSESIACSIYCWGTA